jgi:hypothetical protein
LNLNVNLEDIKIMKKGNFKNMLKQSIEQKVLKDLEEKKASHSKVKHLKHGFLKMKAYLMPTKVKITKEERQLIHETKRIFTITVFAL